MRAPGCAVSFRTQKPSGVPHRMDNATTSWARLHGADSVLKAAVNAPRSDPAHADDGHAYLPLSDLRGLPIAATAPPAAPAPTESQLRKQLRLALILQREADAQAEQAEQARQRAEQHAGRSGAVLADFQDLDDRVTQ